MTKDEGQTRKQDWIVAAALCLLGALARLPYLALIPRFDDEVMQAVYALSIRPGQFMPLVGNDPYVGPLFSYLVAACQRVLGMSPVAPRLLVMGTSALAVGLTYGLARALGLRPWWAALAGLLAAANPHLIYNSHYAGSTYLLPLFCVAFWLALALAARRESGIWLMAAGALFGLALQSNPVAALTLPGAAVWFVLQRKQRIGWRTRWPYLAVLAFLLAYAPVIVYNLQNELHGAVIAGNKQGYIWQANPSALTYARNMGRLLLQLGRQTGGVLGGDETPQSLLGLPLLLSAWAAAGLLRSARQLDLTALALCAHLLVMPWVSGYYGDAYIARFTIQLTPLIAVAMAQVAAQTYSAIWPRPPGNRFSRQGRLAAAALLVALSLGPLALLWRFYEEATARGETNARQLAFLDEFLRGWQGEPVLVSDSVNRPFYIVEGAGEYNATEYLLATRGVPYRLMPMGRLLEYLATGQAAGRLTLVLSEDDVPQAQAQANLIEWDSPAMRAARERGYGAYTLADARQVRKPAYVLTDVIPVGSTLRRLQANWSDQLSLIGYEPDAEPLHPGERFIVRLYWQALRPMSEGYIGFVHLVGPAGQLVAQDDHELGRGVYRTLAWRTDEVIRERYEWIVPQDAPHGDYELRAGVYSFPSLKRLPLRSASVTAQDELVTLGAVHVGP